MRHGAKQLRANSAYTLLWKKPVTALSQLADPVGGTHRNISD